jgi:hypothetical protein
MMMCTTQLPFLDTLVVQFIYSMGICINCVFSVDEVNTTQVTLRNIQWMDLASKTIAARPSTKVIQYLLNEATRLQIGEEKLVLHIRELAEAALCWESKAEQALKHGESFDNCVKLIRLSRHSISPLLMI